MSHSSAASPTFSFFFRFFFVIIIVTAAAVLFFFFMCKQSSLYSSSMLTPSHTLLRRRGNGHVVKYLEGVPTPSKLIDHLAGADLHASAELPFFNTVPRYVDTQREPRLSKLFFHHVLYPAGGARLPYQAVVVRGGRAVRPSSPRLWHRTTASEGGTGSTTGTAPPLSTSPVSAKAPQPRSNPLAVPASQLGPSSPPATSSTQVNASATAAIATALVEDVPSSAAWARVDPARRPYFSTRATTPFGKKNRHRNLHADSGPAATNLHLPPSRRGADDVVPAARAVEDSVLTPLRGVVEYFYNSGADASTAEAPGPGTVEEKVQQQLVSPFGGLLWLSEACSDDSSANRKGELSSFSSSALATSVWERLLESIQKRSTVDAAAATTAASTKRPRTSVEGAPLPSGVRTGNTFAYVQTRLPPSATVVLPVGRKQQQQQCVDPTSASPVHGAEDDDDVFLCRMAGGVEPVVSFAVGRPLTTPPIPSAFFSSVPSSPSDVFFSHMSCLTRVNMQVSLPQASCAPASAATAAPSTTAGTHSAWHDTHASNDGEQKSSTSGTKVQSRPTPLPAEPWKLGDDGLDLMVPQHVRTVAERHPTKLPHRFTTAVNANLEETARGSARYVLGRTDAETYLLPQRELLLTLYLPTHTEDMCAAQNNDRLQRQVRAGRASRSAMAWPTEQARLTSARRALGQYANTESAGKTGTSHPSPPSATEPAALQPKLFSRLSYEVRALPGDVVYIPRGWGYEVQRILGTATIHNGHSSSSAAAPYEFRDHRIFGSKYGSTVNPRRATPSAPHAENATAVDQRQEQQKVGVGEAAVAAAGAVATPLRVVSVEIDAFCLHYHPYPELTAAQAAVYMAANYVHTGVEEFYEKGGNQVFRCYE